MHPLLSICIPSYNRAEWLSFTTKNIVKQIEPLGEEVELVISDNASEDNTQEKIEYLKGHPQVRIHRNETNLGANQNFLKCTELARGKFIWMIGNDDLIREGAVKRIVTELNHSPDIEYIFVNYTKFSPPKSPKDLPESLPFHPTGSEDLSEYRIKHVGDIASLDYNCFTPIYCSIIKREDMLKATQMGVEKPFFETIETTVPQGVYVVENLLNKPGYYIGYPYVIASHDITWGDHAPFYVLECLPQLYEKLERQGISRKVVNAHRKKLLRVSKNSLYFMLTHPNALHRERFSFKKYCTRNVHLLIFWVTLLELLPSLLHYYTSKHFWLPKIRPSQFTHK